MAGRLSIGSIRQHSSTLLGSCSSLPFWELLWPLFKSSVAPVVAAARHAGAPPDIILQMVDRKSKGPAVGIATAFILTTVGARLFSVFLPWVHWEPVPGMHIHHYVYGIFILVISGYLALVFKGNGATPWIGALYGLG